MDQTRCLQYALSSPGSPTDGPSLNLSQGPLYLWYPIIFKTVYCPAFSHLLPHSLPHPHVAGQLVHHHPLCQACHQLCALAHVVHTLSLFKPSYSSSPWSRLTLFHWTPKARVAFPSSDQNSCDSAGVASIAALWRQGPHAGVCTKMALRPESLLIPVGRRRKGHQLISGSCLVWSCTWAPFTLTTI